MGFFTQFGLLFSNMEWYVIVCMILGIVLLFIELFQPGFGIFGISGFVFIVASIVLRAVFRKPEDDALTQVFQMLLIYFIVIGIGVIVFIVAYKKKWLQKTPFVQGETAVATEFSDGTADFSYLLGKQGTAVTDLRPAGKAEIEGKIYDVVAENFFIPAESAINVKSVEGVKIGVEITKKQEE